MSETFVVFHQGLGVSAVRLEQGTYVHLDESGRVGAQFKSFDDWYVGVLRAEYAERYGL